MPDSLADTFEPDSIDLSVHIDFILQRSKSGPPIEKLRSLFIEHRSIFSENLIKTTKLCELDEIFKNHSSIELLNAILPST